MSTELVLTIIWSAPRISDVQEVLFLLAHFMFRKKNLKSQRPELFYVLLGWGTDFPEFLQLRFVREQFVNKYSKKVIESYLKVRSCSQKGTCVS